ncbi:YjbF family lipoprotein [Pectobacterium brasiliense]|uniref:YjbF family lipoprotein n=1 Tax=Pectobacterium brasiliense TaxID=180957 RepID=UPI001968B54A|nr:YjbF family lipoprotein [Pectobacterium brasiliense]MBN3055444.1 YjbF family lipoprotein [Pectobacterium brasiliense]MBN3255783.1 YjbF family lipoprotein [Pectobacterium brasiliense]
MTRIKRIAEMKALIAIPLFSILLTGCSQNMEQVGKTFKLAFLGQDDTHVTAKQVANTPYASAYLKVGKAPQAFVVLAFAEQNQLKWIGADKNIVATQHGRLVKTQGFGEDITYVDNLQQDPLTLGLLKTSTPMTWQSRVEWAQVFRGGYATTSVFHARGKETVKILDTSRELLRFDEQVTVSTLNESYTNSYWLDPANGSVVQSQQYMGPGMALVTFTVLKPYAQ